MSSIDGLISGLDTTSIIEGLVSLQQQQVDRLNLRKSAVVAQQSAFAGIEARVQGLRSTIGQLNRSTSSVFTKTVGTSSNEDILTVSTGSKAREGSFQVSVQSLARAHQIGSQGFSSDTAEITQGTISFRVGDRPETEITIDQSNNSVNGLVDAINAQSDDISASVIFDQANNANRILLTSRDSGESNQITVTNNLAATAGDATQPDFSGLAIQEASNATIRLGSGAGAIVAEYESNKVDGLIEGVTLDLQSFDADASVTINIARDTAAAVEGIESFVEGYNSLIDYIDQQTSFNTETGNASPLIGNRNVSTLKTRLSTLITEAIPGLSGDLNRLSQLGIRIGDKGNLIVNSSELTSALNGEVDGIEPDDIRRVFGLTGESSSAGVQFLLGSGRTQASTSSYEVDILQAAEQARILATSAIGSAGNVIDGTNNEFQISLDGQASEVLTLAEGTYTDVELAEQIQSVINASAELQGQKVAVSVEGGRLEITSLSYGKSSEVKEITGSAAASLGFDGSESDEGQDVAGSFIVDGVVETATGSGRILIGDSDNANTADLQVRVTLGAAQVAAGVESTLDVTRGVTSRLDQLFGEILDPEVGTVKISNDDFDLRIESLESSIARVNSISEAKTEYLIQQFAALERVLSELQTTSNFVSSQLGSI